MALYGLSGQENRIGLFPFSVAKAAEHCGLMPTQGCKVFNSVREKLDWGWDKSVRVLYIPSWWKSNPVDNPSELRGHLKDLIHVPDTPLIKLFLSNTTHLPANCQPIMRYELDKYTEREVHVPPHVRPSTILCSTLLNSTNNPQPLSGADTACTYCGVLQSQVDWAFDLDHFIPKAAGGTDDPSNLLPCCHVCNQIKQKRLFGTIEEASVFIHATLWKNNRQRYTEPRKLCFGGRPPVDFLRPEALVDAYREENTKLPDIMEFSKERRAKALARLSRSGEKFLADFREAVRRAQQIPFLYGDSARKWKASFDWFIENDTNVLKVLEGKYGGRTNANSSGNSQAQGTLSTTDYGAEFRKRAERGKVQTVPGGDGPAGQSVP